MTTEKILLSPREVAAHFGLSIRQLARWRAAGTGPPWYALPPPASTPLMSVPG